MPSLTASLIAGMVSLAALASQTAPDRIDRTRSALEEQRRGLLEKLGDGEWMGDAKRAALIRLQIESNWKQCAENEALALAQASDRSARLLVESALATCRPWQHALELALRNGSYPYVEGPPMRGRASREDMVALTELDSRDAALARILAWRGLTPAADAPPPKRADRARIEPRPLPERLAPPDPEETPQPANADPAAETEIVVVARIEQGCRVRLADRTLTGKELAAKAREWTAKQVALKVVRPRRADYRCMAKIARQLGEQGLRFFEFVEASSLNR